MRKLALVILLVLPFALPASAQRINLDLPGLAGLADRADDVVDVTLDASMLKLAAKFLGGNDPEEREVRDLISGLQGIYVRSYEFSKEGEYDRKLVDQIRTQLGASWKPLVTVRSKTKENVNIMADVRGERVVGLVILSAEPRELTIVNIVGNIDIDRLSKLEGEFGIPKITKGGNDE